MSTEPFVRKIFSEGIILAFGTAYIYLATFLYEYGFCKNFGIPPSLINPSLATLLIAAATIGGIFLSSLKFIGISAPLWRAARDPKRRSFREFFGINAIFVFIGAFLVTIYGLTRNGAISFIIVWVIIHVVYFGPVLLFNRKKTSS